MKEFFTKNWKTILIIVIVVIAIWYFFLRKKKPAMGTGSNLGIKILSVDKDNKTVTFTVGVGDKERGDGFTSGSLIKKLGEDDCLGLPNGYSYCWKSSGNSIIITIEGQGDDKSVYKTETVTF